MVFVDDGEVEKTTLRQGDVATDIHWVGTVCFKQITIPSGVVDDEKPKRWSVSNELERGPVAIISHCCELDRTNGVKLTSIILAPIRDVAKATSPNKIQELIDSNIISRSGMTYSYLKYFYVPPTPKLPFDRGGVIDISKIFSVRKTSYDVVLDRKILQMTELGRDAFALKVGLYFYRQLLAA
jgi:hypothetical protein